MATWITIPDFSNYQASNNGELLSLNYKRTGRARRLKPSVGKDGYLQTMIKRDDGKYCSWKVHKFVALAWLGEKPKGTEVNHKNGIKSDNSIGNLEYVTHAENCKHSFDTGLQKPKRGELNGMNKYKDEFIREIYNEYLHRKNNSTYNRKALASLFNVKVSLIKDIISKSRYKWLKY